MFDKVKDMQKLGFMEMIVVKCYSGGFRKGRSDFTMNVKLLIFESATVCYQKYCSVELQEVFLLYIIIKYICFNNFRSLKSKVFWL